VRQTPRRLSMFVAGANPPMLVANRTVGPRAARRRESFHKALSCSIQRAQSGR
jgi:hypothetical protein